MEDTLAALLLLFCPLALRSRCPAFSLPSFVDFAVLEVGKATNRYCSSTAPNSAYTTRARKSKVEKARQEVRVAKIAKGIDAIINSGVNATFSQVDMMRALRFAQSYPLLS